MINFIETEAGMGWEAAGDPWTGGMPGRDAGLPGVPAGFEHGGPASAACWPAGSSRWRIVHVYSLNEKLAAIDAARELGIRAAAKKQDIPHATLQPWVAK